MKRFIALTTIMCAIMASAQKYEPTEGWPYIYSDFKQAIVYYNNGDPESARVNVHIANNELHFTDGENIMLVRAQQHIDSVVLDDGVIFLRKGNSYVQQLGKTNRIILGHTTECDFNALTDSNGAYGTSTTTAATQNVSSFKDHGNMAALRYKEMKDMRNDTRSLPTIERLIFIIDNRAICQANKRGVTELLNKEQKKAFNTFLKQNKIKWKNQDSLMLVAQYLEGILDEIALD